MVGSTAERGREGKGERFLPPASPGSWVFRQPPSDVQIKQRDAELERLRWKSLDPGAQMRQIPGGIYLGAFSQGEQQLGALQLALPTAALLSHPGAYRQHLRRP